MKTKIFETIAAALPEVSKEMKASLKSRTPDDYKYEFIEVIRRRILHCEENCLYNLDEAQVCERQTIVWTGGHFSIPVHAALRRALTCAPHEWDRLVWQQIVRQLYEDEMKDEVLFRIATEALLVL